MLERRRHLLLAMLGAPGLVFAQLNARDQRLPALVNLRETTARIARYRAPLLVLFSTPGCPYCHEVRTNYLAPRVAEQARELTPLLLVHETDITSTQIIIDLSGAPITESAFAARFNVRVVPVVALFDQRLQSLGEPLVGLDRSGFYEAYLSSAIDQARKRLRSTT